MAVDPAHSDRPTAQVGNLILRRWLAQGGMAELYLATSADPAQSSEVVVLKRVLPQFSSSSNFVRMFAREARLASMLQHPNIVGVRDAGGLGAEDCFFTMEYIHGIDLGQMLDRLRLRGGALPLAHALTIAVAMCAGLQHAHEATDAEGKPLGIVHRDVSPSNVLLGFNGAIKVTDFGVAKALAMTRLTEEGTRKGKLCYMSPEQATGETVDRRADVFAIATVLYELTTMERLFGGDNDLAVIHNLIHRPRPRPREVSPGYPAALEAIVMKAVAKNIDERFPTALALQQALEGFAAEVGLVLSSDGVGSFVRQTIEASVHPRDDPKFMSSVIALRSPPQMVTEVQVEHAAVTDGAIVADARAVAPTGSHPSVPSGAGSQGMTLVSPGVSTPAASMPSINSASLQSFSGANPRAVDPSAPSAAWPQTPPPSALHKWSLALAIVALLAAAAAGYMVWMTSQTSSPVEPRIPAVAEPERADPVADPADPAEPEPDAPVEPEPTPEPEPEAQAPTTPAVQTAPKGRRRGKRRNKKRPVGEPEPVPTPTPAPTPPPEEPTSKKPSPTDTLLPIRE